ncbi:hypothetical protein D3C75_373420 [compost metagenome]
MRGKGVGEQAGAVFNFRAFGGLLAEFAGAVHVLGINARFRPVDFRIGVEPVVAFRGNMITELGIALDGGAVGHWVAAGIRINGLWVLWLLRGVVVIAQRAVQRLGAVQLPAAFGQHVVDRFVIRCGAAAALADIAAIAA